jgi:OPT family oligopeptide transporter
MNVWNSQYLPMSSVDAFDNTGHTYNLSRIIGPDKRIDITAYKEYSPLFLAITFAMSYGLSFLAISATVTHTILYLWKPIKAQFRKNLDDRFDVHARLMSKYPQVPEWWYASLFAVTFAFSAVCITVWRTDMEVSLLVLALVISLVYVIPIGMIQAITNRQIGLNVITELIIGYISPGRPVAMMMCASFFTFSSECVV